MTTADIVTLIAAVGGAQGIVELLRYWRSRRLNERRDTATVQATEDENRRRQVTWLEERLAERDKKIDAIYSELRAEQAKCLEEVHLRHEVELRLKETEVRKCLVHGCKDRQPPSDY